MSKKRGIGRETNLETDTKPLTKGPKVSKTLYVTSPSLLQGLITDAAKLQSYIDHALVPWVEAVKDHPALGSWDVVNELEGVIITGERRDEPCFDTRFLRWSTAGFAGELYHAEDLLRLVRSSSSFWVLCVH